MRNGMIIIDADGHALDQESRALSYNLLKEKALKSLYAYLSVSCAVFSRYRCMPASISFCDTIR